MKVLLAASEAVPFIKTGGLADVMGALPAKLRREGVETALVIPKYSRVAERFGSQMETVWEGTVDLAWRRQYVGVEKIVLDGVPVFFIDNDLKEYVETPYSSTEDYYRHVIAEKTMAEQRLIVSLLRQNGILSILTPPENLSVDVINKYLEIRRKS